MVNLKGLVSGVLFVIIGLVIMLTMTGETIGDIQTAGNTVNATGAPLSGLFAGDSIVPLIFLGAILIASIGMAFKMSA